MEDQKIKIGISLRVVDTQNYKETRDALSHDWPILFEKIKIDSNFYS